MTNALIPPSPQETGMSSHRLALLFWERCKLACKSVENKNGSERSERALLFFVALHSGSPQESLRLRFRRPNF